MWALHNLIIEGDRIRCFVGWQSFAKQRWWTMDGTKGFLNRLFSFCFFHFDFVSLERRRWFSTFPQKCRLILKKIPSPERICTCVCAVSGDRGDSVCFNYHWWQWSAAGGFRFYCERNKHPKKANKNGTFLTSLLCFFCRSRWRGPWCVGRPIDDEFVIRLFLFDEQVVLKKISHRRSLVEPSFVGVDVAPTNRTIPID